MGVKGVMTWTLIDTDILIDVGRGETLAIKYLQEMEQRSFLAISAITQMELLVGCNNKREQRAVDQFLKRFEILPVTEDITEEAIALLKKYKLSHGLLIADALIAATAITQNFFLASKNQRDYRFINHLHLLRYPADK